MILVYRIIYAAKNENNNQNQGYGISENFGGFSRKKLDPNLFVFKSFFRPLRFSQIVEGDHFGRKDSIF